MTLRHAAFILVILLLLVLLWLGNLALLTRQNSTACPPAVQEEAYHPALAQLLNAYSAADGGTGLQVAVIFSNGAVWQAASGLAHIGRGCTLSLSHHLGAGSVTKLYTAVLVMQQVERGAFSLDDTLERWFDLPFGSQVTIRHLLGHTSGIPEYTSDLAFLTRYLGQPRHVWTTDELVAILENRQLQFPPGTRYSYSNANYMLLGALLERATGQSYSALLRTNILEPLDLSETNYPPLPGGYLLADAYDRSVLRLGRQNLTGMRVSLHSGAFSAGGIFSTALDLARFTRALFGGRVLSQASLNQMLTFKSFSEADMPTQTGYGLGVRRLRIDDRELIGHSGAIPGYSAVSLYSRATGYTITVLSNLSTVDQIRLVSEIQRLIYP